MYFVDISFILVHRCRYDGAGGVVEVTSVVHTLGCLVRCRS